MDDFGKAFDKQRLEEQYLDKQHFDQPYDECIDEQRFDINLAKAHEEEEEI